MMVKLTISRKGIEELFCVVEHKVNGEILSLKPEYFNLRKYVTYWGKKDYEFYNNYLESNHLYFLDGEFDDINHVYNFSVIGFYVEENEEIIFEFPDDFPEEELFYFKLKYC